MTSSAPKPGFCVGEKVCWWLMLLGAAMVAAPFLAPDYFSGWNGGQFAMALVGCLVGPSAFFSSFLFRRRRLVRDQLFDDKRLLVRWTYTEAEWRSFTGQDYERERRDKWQLFRIVAFFCVVIGGAFAVCDWEGGRWVLAVLLGLVAVIAGVIVLTTRGQRQRREASGGEVRIGEDGLWLAGELHVWTGWGGRFERVLVVEGQPPCIEFVYSTPAKNQRQEHSVRVPIPTGYDAEAAGIVAHFVEKSGRA
jgi:hypothetical protein